MEKKAYAIASKLQRYHYDNCKVPYALHPVRSWVHEMLKSWFEEAEIIGSYRRALAYCHRLTTDEILNRERLQHEKDHLGLVFHLAEKELKASPLTPFQRRARYFSNLRKNSESKNSKPTESKSTLRSIIAEAFGEDFATSLETPGEETNERVNRTEKTESNGRRTPVDEHHRSSRQEGHLLGNQIGTQRLVAGGGLRHSDEQICLSGHHEQLEKRSRKDAQKLCERQPEITKGKFKSIQERYHQASST